MALWALGIPDNRARCSRRASLWNPNVFDLNPVLEGFAQQMECGVTGGAPNPLRRGRGRPQRCLGRAIYGEIDAATALDEAAFEGEAILNR